VAAFASAGVATELSDRKWMQTDANGIKGLGSTGALPVPMPNLCTAPHCHPVAKDSNGVFRPIVPPKIGLISHNRHANLSIES